MAGIAAWTHGRWSEARRLLDGAEAQLRERCTGVAWEIDMAQMYGLASLFFLGEVAELSRRLPVLVKDAHGRGDLLALTNLRLGFFSHIAWLAADDPATARQELQAGLDGWSRQRFDFPRIWARGTERDIALYSGEPLLAPEPMVGPLARPGPDPRPLHPGGADPRPVFPCAPPPGRGGARWEPRPSGTRCWPAPRRTRARWSARRRRGATRWPCSCARASRRRAATPPP